MEHFGGHTPTPGAARRRPRGDARRRGPLARQGRLPARPGRARGGRGAASWTQLAELPDEEVTEQLIAVKGLGPVDRAHVPDLPPRPAGRAAGGRPRDPQGGPGPLRARTSYRRRPSSSASPSRGGRTARWRASTSGARWTTRPFSALRRTRRTWARRVKISLGDPAVPTVLETEPAARGRPRGRPASGPSAAATPVSNVVAHDRVRVEVALRGPGGDHLAAALARAAEIGQLARGQGRAGLLLELAASARLRVLVVAVLALGDRPRTRRPCSSRTGRPDGRAGPRGRRTAQAVEQTASADASRHSA